MTRERPGIILALGLVDVFCGVLGFFLGIGMVGKQALQLGLQPVLPKRTMPPWTAVGSPVAPQVEVPELPFYLQQTLPSYLLAEVLNGLIVVLCGALLLAIGYGLLHMRPAARWLAWAYSAFAIAWQIGFAVYQTNVVLPTIEAYFRSESQQRWYYGNVETYVLACGFFLTLQVGLVAGHAVIQAVILVLPTVNAAFAGKPVRPPDKAPEPAGTLAEAVKLEAGA